MVEITVVQPDKQTRQYNIIWMFDVISKVEGLERERYALYQASFGNDEELAQLMVAGFDRAVKEDQYDLVILARDGEILKIVSQTPFTYTEERREKVFSSEEIEGLKRFADTL